MKTISASEIKKLHISLDASTVTVDADAAHPNKMKFKGVLTRVGEPSTKPPGGAQGHRINLPIAVAKKRLNTLKGMGINYDPGLDTHAQRRKVGVIESSEIKGHDLWVEGHIWKHDFPEAEKDLKQTGLGMSMEIGHVSVADTDASIWEIDDCVFLGGTVLWKDSAAYYHTTAIAARAEQGGKGNMAITKKKGVAAKTSPVAASATKKTPDVVSVAAAAAANATAKTLAGPIRELAASNKITNELLERLINLQAGTAEEDEDEIEAGADDEEDEDADDVTAGADEDDEAEDDDEDVSAEADEEVTAGKGKKKKDDEDDDEEEVDAESADADNTEVGGFNKNPQNKGNKTTHSTKVGKMVKKPITGSADVTIAAQAKQIKQLKKQLAAAAENKGELGKLKTQIEAAARDTNRRSVSVDASALLSKSGLNAGDMQASGQKLTVAEADSLFNVPGLNMDPQTRMALKANLHAAGLMEDGAVNRSTR